MSLLCFESSALSSAVAVKLQNENAGNNCFTNLPWIGWMTQFILINTSV